MNDELIARLKKYVDASRFFEVRYRSSRVYGIDERKPEHGIAGWPAFYLSRDLDDPFEFDKTKPADFSVLMLKPVNWTEQDPNWREADPEAWDEAHK